MYPWLFESRTPADARKLTRYPRTPGPFVLEPADCRFDSDSDTLNLGIILFGQANEQFPYVALALQQAGHTGLTSRRIRLELKELQVEEWPVEAGGREDSRGSGTTQNATGHNPGNNDLRSDHSVWKTFYEPGSRLAPIPARYPPIPPCPRVVCVKLLTPLRMRKNNHLVNESSFDFRGFASVLVRRISMLTTFFGETPLETDFAGLLQRAESIAIVKRDLHWQEWARYSSRQKSKIRMGGLLGWFILEGTALGSVWPYLWLGQWTHTGRGCSMGLGRYTLILPEDSIENGAVVNPEALYRLSPLKL